MDHSHKRNELAILILLFISLRFFALMLLRPGGFITDFSDFHVSFLPFAQWSRYGLYPYQDFWMEYPPLLPWMVVAVYKASLLLPPWDDPRLWFNTLIGLSVLLFDTGNLVLIYLMGYKLWGWEKGRLTGWIYLGLFATFYTALGWLDNIPLFFVLLSLYLWIGPSPKLGLIRALLSGASLGMGFMFKVVPALLLPLGFRALKKREFVLCLAGFSIVAGVLAVPFVVLNPDMFITSFRAMMGRSPWETVWAIMNGYYSYGVIAGDRFSTPESFAVYPSRIPGLLPLLLWGLIYFWLILRLRHQGEPSRLVTSASLVFFSYEALTTGYSPQHIVYFLPFLILLMPNPIGVAGAISFTLINLFEAVGYFIIFPEERWLLLMAVLLRTLGLLILAGICFLKITERHLKFGQWALKAWISLVVLCLAVAIVPLGKEYFQNRLAKTPCAGLQDKLQSYEAGINVVFLRGSLYDSLYPYLGRKLRAVLLPESALASSSLEEERLAFFERVGIREKFLVIVNQSDPFEVEALNWLEKTFGNGLRVSEAGSCVLMEFDRE
ncbi:MAG: hypothetical protein RMK30_08230 [Anaerolineae bacterium]|nr:hypothetical protein [Anaerolineae bacterium]MDW8102848.1 hypothetical protein [Anaerolineae bacterium]